MRIAIIGAGHVGGGLGAAFAASGHDVVFGVREPESERARAALAAAPGTRATSLGDAVEGADIIVFTLRPEAVPGIVARLPSLDGRIAIDAMNRLDGDPARSMSQELADLLPGVRIVKAFNTIGFENFPTARERKAPAAMFVAADDPDAKRAPMDLAGEIGFEACDAGSLANAKPLEEMVKVGLALSRTFGRNGRFRDLARLSHPCACHRPQSA